MDAQVTREETRETNEETNNKSRMRGKKQSTFIENKSYRNVFDQRQREQINNKLKEWFSRSGAVTIALTLVKEDDSSYFVQYLGHEAFHEFVEDEYIQSKFVNVALSGVKERAGGLKRPHSGDSIVQQDVDADIKSLLLSQDQGFLRLVVGEKCKLIARIVKGGQRQGKLWREENRPSWWPLEVFRSPNSGSPRMRVEEMDSVLTAFRDHLRDTQDLEPQSEQEISVLESQATERAEEAKGFSAAFERLEETAGEPQSEQEISVLESQATERAEEAKGFSAAFERLEETAGCVTAWNPEVSNQFLSSIPPNADAEFLKRIIGLLPRTCGIKTVSKTWLQSDVEICVRHQVPQCIRGEKEPICIPKDQNEIFHAVSTALYGTDAYSPLLRLCSTKIGLERMKLIMEKLQLTNVSRVEEEILETLVDRGRRSLVHFGMLAEALNVDIKCHSANNEFSCTYKSGNAWAEVDVLWYFGDEGQCHVYPLIELPEKIQQLCLAYDCAEHFGCSTGEDPFYCPFCCQTYHRKCLGKIYDNCCGCHALAKVLPVKSRLSQGDSIKRMLQNGTSMLETHIRMVIKESTFSPKVQLFKNLEDNEVLLYYCGRKLLRNWVGDENSAVTETLLGHVARIAATEKKLAAMDFTSRVIFNKDVLLPEILAYLVGREERITLARAREILERPPRLQQDS